MDKFIRGILSTISVIIAGFIIISGLYLYDESDTSVLYETENETTKVTEKKILSESNNSAANNLEKKLEKEIVALETELVQMAESILTDEATGEFLNKIGNMANEISNGLADEITDELTTQNLGTGTEETDEEMEGSFLSDTSDGLWFMGYGAEQGGYLYFCDDDMIYRQKLDGSKPERLIVSEYPWTATGNIMATEQYLYIEMAHSFEYKIFQFQLNGVKVGPVADIGYPYMCYTDGYFYYNNEGNIYRRKAEPGSMEELISDSYNNGYIGFNDGKIYYTNKSRQFVQVNMDGTGQRILDQDSNLRYPLQKSIIDGKLYYHEIKNFEENYITRDLLTQNTVTLKLPITTEPGYSSILYNGHFIGDYLIVQVWDQYKGDVIYRYDPDTGDIAVIIHAERDDARTQSFDVKYVAGETKVYYEVEEYIEADHEHYRNTYCVNLDGSNPICLGAFSLSSY